jgi:hypothetical protein
MKKAFRVLLVVRYCCRLPRFPREPKRYRLQRTNKLQLSSFEELLLHLHPRQYRPSPRLYSSNSCRSNIDLRPLDSQDGVNPSQGGGFFRTGGLENLQQEDEWFYPKALVVASQETRKISVSSLGKALNIGANQAWRLLERMEREGRLGPPDRLVGPTDSVPWLGGPNGICWVFL